MNEGGYQQTNFIFNLGSMFYTTTVILLLYLITYAMDFFFKKTDIKIHQDQDEEKGLGTKISIAAIWNEPPNICFP